MDKTLKEQWAEIEELARKMTKGDPDRLVHLSYDRVCGYSPIKSFREVVFVPAWYLHKADAWSILNHRV